MRTCDLLGIIWWSFWKEMEIDKILAVRFMPVGNSRLNSWIFSPPCWFFGKLPSFFLWHTLFFCKLIFNCRIAKSFWPFSWSIRFSGAPRDFFLGFQHLYLLASCLLWTLNYSFSVVSYKFQHDFHYLLPMFTVIQKAVSQITVS